MWNNFSLITADEEIINNRYSVNSLFKISSDLAVLADPKVKAVYQNQKIIIGVDQSMILIENEQNITDCIHVSFESPIDCLTVSSDGSLVICASSDGNIYGIYINGIVLFHLTIDRGDVNMMGSSFVGVENRDEEYYFMCHNGKMYKLWNINKKQLSETMLQHDENVTMPANETLINNVILDVALTSNLKKTISSFALFDHHELVTAILGGEKHIKFSNSLSEKNVNFPLGFGGAKKCFNLNHFILVLSNSGALFDACPNTNMIQKFDTPEDEIVEDLIVIEMHYEKIELLLLVQSKSTQKRNIKIVDFPSWKCKYEIPVPANSWIINQPKLSANMYYLSGKLSGSGTVEFIELRVISETQPENRLTTLIQRGLLKEAEKFAVEFKLSLQPIYEAKAKIILNEIGENLNDNKELVSARFQEFFKVAKLITDTEFLLKLRLMEIGDRNVMKQVLEFLMEHINFEKNPTDIDEIKEQLLRLETLRTIDPYECDSKWREFVNHDNIVNYCFKYFESDISVACLILKQHASSIVPFLNELTVLKMLNEIPEQIEPFGIIQWLRQYVPVVSKVHPNALPKLTNWAVAKTTSFQYTKQWPENGLEFGNNMLDIFSGINYLFPSSQRQYDTCLDKIRKVINALQDLFLLKNNFNLTLTFNDYINDSIEDSAFQILRRINITKLEKLVDSFLKPIFAEKGMSPVPTLIMYIKSLIRNRKGSSMWQERAVACTLSIHNEEEKLKSAIEILKVAPVPWSNVLDPLVKYRSSSHRLASEIQTAYEMQILRIKYGWDENATGSNTKFVFRIIKMNYPDLIKDLKTFTEFDPTIKQSSNYYAVNNLSLAGDVEKAIQLLSSLNDADRRDCCSKVLKITTIFIEDELDNPIAFDGLMELLRYVNTLDVGLVQEKSLYESLLRIQQLRNKFKINATALSLKESAKINLYLQQGIDYTIEVLKETKQKFVNKACHHIQILAKALNVDIVRVVIKLATQVKHVRFTSALAKFVLNLCSINSDNCDALIDLAVLLMSQQILMLDDDKCDNHNVAMSYPLAYRLLDEAQRVGFIFSDDTCELLNWTRIGNNIYSLEAIDEYLKADVELDENIVEMIVKSITEVKIVNSAAARRDPLSVFEQIKEVTNSPKTQSDTKPDSVIKCLCLGLAIILKDLEFVTPFTKRFKPHSLPKLSNIRTDFCTSLDYLIKIKQYSTASIILQSIRKKQENTGKLIISNDLFSTLNKKMLRSALMQKEPPFETILPILSSDMNPVDCLSYLENLMKTGMAKVNFLSLAKKYGEMTGDMNRTTIEQESRLKCIYYIKLCQIDPQLESDPNFSITTHEQLFADLNNKIVDVSLLERISEDFLWNFQKVLITQIYTILAIQALDFDTTYDMLGKEQIVVKLSVEKVVAMCQPYLSHLTETKLLAAKLLEYNATINQYFYEMYLCIIEILNQINELPPTMEKWSNILQFLKHKTVTKRSNRINQAEADSWLKSQPDTVIMPKISKFRIPFWNLVHKPLKDILDNEVNIENCEEWFPLIRLHSNLSAPSTQQGVLSLDHYRTRAVINSILDYKVAGQNRPEGSWNTQPLNNAFLQSVLQIVGLMHDAEYAFSLLYFVTNNAPEGADQVEAAYECFKFAQVHDEELRSSELFSKKVEKIRCKYQMFKTQHLLHLYGLADDRFLKLKQDSKELINALYFHDYVIKMEKKVDINQVCQEIATLHGIDFYTMQIGLLQKWLSFNSDENPDEMKQTYVDDMNVRAINSESDEISGESVARAYYVLSSWDKKTSTDFLISHIYSIEDGESSSTGRQLQVIECLIRIVDEDTDSTFMEMVSTPQYIALKCVHLLKQFGFKLSVEKFQGYDKLKILKQVLSTHATNPKALEVISYICIGYNIFEPVIWNSLLQQMAQLHMHKELTTIIDDISTNSSLVHLPGMVSAWEYLVRYPLKNIKRVRSEEQDRELSKVLFQLQSCPVKSKMKLYDMAEICVRLSQVHIAAILIAFVDGEQKAKIVELIRQNITPALKKEILDLEEYGVHAIVTKVVIKELKL